MTKTDGEPELVLGNKQLLSAFFIVVVLLGVLGAAAYRMAPGLWEQLMADRQREIVVASHRPTPRLWPDQGLHAAWLGHSTVLLKIDGFTMITDPVLYSHVGVDLRITQIGMKRLVAPAFRRRSCPRST